MIWGKNFVDMFGSEQLHEFEGNNVTHENRVATTVWHDISFNANLWPTPRWEYIQIHVNISCNIGLMILSFNGVVA